MMEKGLTTMQNNDTLEKIIKAAMEGKTVIIKYRDSKGVVTERETEPYEVRGNMYWGYALDKNAIRQFNMLNILGATITSRTYAPRWPVKIN
jgi:predicted DNA-binding transcriptional regulator YafY